MHSITTITTYWKSHEVASYDSGYGMIILQPASKYLGIIISIGILFLVLGLIMRSSKVKFQWRSSST